MANSREYNWYLVKGDDETRIFTYQDSAGDPIDLTGYTASIVIRNNDTDITIAGVVNGAAGTVTVNVPNATTSLFAGVCTFEVKIVSPAAKIRTIVYGDMRLLK